MTWLSASIWMDAQSMSLVFSLLRSVSRRNLADTCSLKKNKKNKHREDKPVKDCFFVAVVGCSYANSSDTNTRKTELNKEKSFNLKSFAFNHSIEVIGIFSFLRT
jgi:hypothetical protein